MSALAGLVALASPCGAASLLPGTSIANDAVATAAGGGTVVGTVSGVYTQVDFFGNITGTGLYTEYAIKGDASNPNGLAALDFLYQVSSLTGNVGKVTMGSYGGFLTNASAVPASAEVPGVTVPLLAVFTPTTAGASVTTAAGTTPIHRTPDPGTTVSFDFNDATFKAAGESDVMIIRTDALTFGLGTISIIDGGTANVLGLAPTPEPGTIVLFGGCLVGVTGAAVRRWRKGNAA